jgi:DNA-binding transcriptional LysR family regulator
MTLRHLHTFAAVYQEGSITAAAKKLNISQPAVSVTIHEMEAYYGVQLFERISKKLYITPAGKELFDCANQILALFDEMNLLADTHKKRYTLKVGCAVSFGELFLPKITKKFLAFNKDVNLSMTIDNGLVIEQKLIDNDLDIGILRGVLHSGDKFRRLVFYEQPMVAICSKENPLAKKTQLSFLELRGQNLLLGEKFSDIRVMVERLFILNNLPINVVLESASIIALINAVGEDLGISVLPLDYVRASQNNNITILKVEDLELKWYINIVYLNKKRLSIAATRFLDFCQTVKDMHTPELCSEDIDYFI